MLDNVVAKQIENIEAENAALKSEASQLAEKIEQLTGRPLPDGPPRETSAVFASHKLRKARRKELDSSATNEHGCNHHRRTSATSRRRNAQ